MSPCNIQLKHPHGPIMHIVQFLPEIEQLKMQGLSKKFYKKIIPVLLKKLSISKTFYFAKNYNNETLISGIKIQKVTKRGQEIRV